MPTIYISPQIKLYYKDPNPSGNPAVLLLHGLGATHESWSFQVPGLIKENYRVIIPDLRGFGQSTYGGRSHTIGDMAADVIALMDAKELVSAHVVGISMGGAIALQLACDYPERVQRLVLVNTFAHLRPQSLKRFLYFASRFVLVHTVGLSTQARFVTQRLLPNPDQELLRQALLDQILQSDPRGYRATMRALARFNRKDCLPYIKNETLIVSGEQDLTVPLPIQRLLAEKIPSACQVIISGAGHAVTGEKPEEFNKVLIQFLST
jgi:3-oxoadipate enol-lactonase